MFVSFPKITVADPFSGITYTAYFPAGNSLPSTLIALLVSKVVGALAPARQTFPLGTNSPQIVLPFTKGLL
jgi:hypothetical protein